MSTLTIAGAILASEVSLIVRVDILVEKSD